MSSGPAPFPFPPTNWDDPCDIARKLKIAYYKIVAGEQVASFSYQAMGVTRTATFNRASLSEIKAAMLQAENECAVQTNQPQRTRYAIQPGARRSY